MNIEIKNRREDLIAHAEINLSASQPLSLQINEPVSRLPRGPDDPSFDAKSREMDEKLVLLSVWFTRQATGPRGMPQDDSRVRKENPHVKKYQQLRFDLLWKTSRVTSSCTVS